MSVQALTSRPRSVWGICWSPSDNQMHAWRHSKPNAVKGVFGGARAPTTSFFPGPMQILEERDPGDPSRACFDAGVDISGGNAPYGQDGDRYRAGGFPQLIESQGFAVDLFGGGGEYRSEHGKIGALLFSPSCFVDSVAGNTNQKPGGGNLSNSRRRDRMGGQMNAVGAGGERNIGAFVDKQLCPTGSRQGDDLASQRQELAAW